MLESLVVCIAVLTGLATLLGAYPILEPNVKQNRSRETIDIM